MTCATLDTDTWTNLVACLKLVVLLDPANRHI